MKKIYQTMKAILLSVNVVLLVSCTEEHEYEPVTADSSIAIQKAYTPTAETVLNLENSELQRLELTVGRPDGSTATTIYLITNSSKFRVPQSVEFEAGGKAKKINVNFDVQPTNTEKVNTKVDDVQAYSYGNIEFDITMNRYISYHVNRNSQCYGQMFRNIDIMKFPRGIYTIKGLHVETEWIDSNMGTITSWKGSENIPYMKPQYIHTQKWNNDDTEDFRIVGLYSDNEKSWKKVDTDILTKDECGKYYPDDDTFESWLHRYSPD